MQLSLELADAINRVPAIPSDRVVKGKKFTEGYFNPKIITFVIENLTVPYG